MSQAKAAEKKEPLIRIAKRVDISHKRAWCIRLAAVLLALASGGGTDSCAGA